MRQLGARLPEMPVDTDEETPSGPQRIEPLASRRPEPVETERVETYPVESHRIERQPVETKSPLETKPVDRPQTTELLRIHEAPRAAENVPTGRWAEFHEFRRLEPGRGARLQLEPMSSQPGPSSRLLSADLDREHRSHFLTLGVPGIAAVLAVGAIVWSGTLRDRMHQQDAAMTALQAQNQKMADTLAQMSTDQKASDALGSSPTSIDAKSPNTKSTDTAQVNTAQPAPADAAQTQESAPAQTAQQATTPAENAADADAAQSAPPQQTAKAAPQRTSRQSGSMQGVSNPPPARQGSGAYRQPVDVGYHPEIVPPYPTNFQSQNVTVNAANSQPVPSAGTYHEPVNVGSYQQPFNVAGSAHSTTPARTVAQPSAPAAPPASNNYYNASGNGAYTSALADNIEAVEGLQRQSQVPLREFHARPGMQTKVTPEVGVSVERPDQGNGSYALVVNAGGSSYQLRGQVNRPLLFTDNSTHKVYELVVLHIADEQVYGYVRPAH